VSWRRRVKAPARHHSPARVARLPPALLWRHRLLPRRHGVVRRGALPALPS